MKFRALFVIVCFCFLGCKSGQRLSDHTEEILSATEAAIVVIDEIIEQLEDDKETLEKSKAALLKPEEPE